MQVFVRSDVIVPVCEHVRESFDPLDRSRPVPDPEVVVESLGPVLEGPIPSLDVVAYAVRQGDPLQVEPLERVPVPRGVVYNEYRSSPAAAHLESLLHRVNRAGDADGRVGFGGDDLPPREVQADRDVGRIPVPFDPRLVEEDGGPPLDRREASSPGREESLELHHPLSDSLLGHVEPPAYRRQRQSLHVELGGFRFGLAGNLIPLERTSCPLWPGGTHSSFILTK